MTGSAGSLALSAPSADDYCSLGMGYPVAVDGNNNPISPSGTTCSVGTYSSDDNNEHHFCKMSENDDSYPGMRAYCILAKKATSETTVQGAFDGFRMVSCALEKNGVTWHERGYAGSGEAATATLDSSCFDEKMLENSCGPGVSSCTTNVQVVAISSPDGYYDASVDLTMGTSYYHAKVKASDGIYEVAMANNGSGNDAAQDDSYVAKYDSSNKSFRYEARADRIDTADSSPWSMHIRLYAEMMDNGLPKVAEAAITEMYRNGTTYNGKLTTVKGAFGGTNPTGLAGQLIVGTSSTTVATAITFDGITPTVSKCYPGDGSPVAIGGSNCTDGALTVPAGALPFSIPGGSYKSNTANASGKYQGALKWFQGLSGLSFTHVDLSAAD